MLRPLFKLLGINHANKLLNQSHNLTLVATIKHLSGNIRYPKPFKGSLTTMKIDTPEFHALFTPELKTLVSFFEKYNYEIRIAGGPVRDLLMDKQPHDIDLATTATPTQMKEMFELEQIRMINTKGESHGTITARINDKENYEVTTLRIDIRTDGRHAEVEFTTDWQLDANRRDLTVNAMFLGLDGTVYDYFNGMEDVKSRTVKFVGTPEDRIQEDYLRILRYFRFYGRIAEEANDHDKATLQAIKDNAEGLAGISGERIWMELKKILVGKYADTIIPTMMDTGITKYMGFPDVINQEEYRCVCERTEGLNPEPTTRLAALLENEDQVYHLNQRLKMSNDELCNCLFIVKYREESESEDVLKHYQHLIAGLSGKEKKVIERVVELLKYKGNKTIADAIITWTPPKLPITGKDLVDQKLTKGPVFAKTLDELRRRWIKSDFQLTHEELKGQILEVVEGIKA